MLASRPLRRVWRVTTPGVNRACSLKFAFGSGFSLFHVGSNAIAGGKLVPRTGYAAWLQRGVSVVAIAGLLNGCAPGSMTTQSQRIGADDGTDSCRQQLV